MVTSAMQLKEISAHKINFVNTIEVLTQMYYHGKQSF